MSRPSITSGPCQENTGFLFAHPCSRPAGAMCLRCGKPVCGLHLSTSPSGELVCKTCLNQDSSDEEAESEGGAEPGEDDPSYYYEDYGYYGPDSSWASGSSRDPDDFTEADGESLRHEDDASFEEDMGGS